MIQMLELDSDEYPKDLETAVHTLAGFASVCWENPGGAGVFDSETAHKGCLELIQWIEKRYVLKETSENFSTQWALPSTLRKLSDADQLECIGVIGREGWLPLSDSHWDEYNNEVLWHRKEAEGDMGREDHPCQLEIDGVPCPRTDTEEIDMPQGAVIYLCKDHRSWQSALSKGDSDG